MGLWVFIFVIVSLMILCGFLCGGFGYIVIVVGGNIVIVLCLVGKFWIGVLY